MIFPSYPRMKKKNGFSLVELLVVISILGILMTLAAASFSTAQSKGRDARRRGDLEAIQKGFEQYFSQNNEYGTCDTMGGETDIFPAGLPSDPQPSQSYTRSCSTTGYCYCALLESEGGGNSTAPASSETCAFASSGATDYFCVTNLQ